MRSLASTFVIVFLSAALASAQNQANGANTQIFTFAHLSTPQDFQNMANAVRTIVGIQQESIDAESKSISVTGTEAQLALGAWLFQALDVAPPDGPKSQEYDVAASPDDVVRVFYLSAASRAPRPMQEIVNVLRVITDAVRVYQIPEAWAICLRGASAQAATAAWLVPLLDQPAGAPGQAGPHQFTIPGALDEPGHAPGSAVAVFYLGHSPTPVMLQDVINAVRVVSDATKIYQALIPMAIVLRGHPEQVSLGGFLIGALDIVPGAQTATAQYTATGDFLYPPDSTAIRVFYLPPGWNAQDAATAVRSSTKSTKVYPCATPRAIAFRGTPEQAELAEAALNQRP